MTTVLKQFFENLNSGFCAPVLGLGDFGVLSSFKKATLEKEIKSHEMLQYQESDVHQIYQDM